MQPFEGVQTPLKPTLVAWAHPQGKCLKSLLPETFSGFPGTFQGLLAPHRVKTGGSWLRPSCILVQENPSAYVARQQGYRKGTGLYLVDGEACADSWWACLDPDVWRASWDTRLCSNPRYPASYFSMQLPCFCQKQVLKRGSGGAGFPASHMADSNQMHVRAGSGGCTHALPPRSWYQPRPEAAMVSGLLPN